METVFHRVRTTVETSFRSIMKNCPNRGGHLLKAQLDKPASFAESYSAVGTVEWLEKNNYYWINEFLIILDPSFNYETNYIGYHF